MSAPPRDQTDDKQQVLVKSNDTHDETDTQQPSDSSSETQGAEIETWAINESPSLDFRSKPADLNLRVSLQGSSINSMARE
ncbi:MAG TPA: hypothetical protein VNF05_11665 [Acidimicrobiales bacterium]|nr:hypothetical protein [Acidimicrobiales bacterium]